MRSTLFAATALALVMALSAPAYAMQVGASSSSQSTGSQSIDGGGQKGAVTTTPTTPGGSKHPQIQPGTQAQGAGNTQSGLIVQGGLEADAGNADDKKTGIISPQNRTGAGGAKNGIILQNNAGNAGNAKSGIIVQGGLQPNAGKAAIVSPDRRSSLGTKAGNAGDTGILIGNKANGVVAPIDSKASTEEIIGEEGVQEGVIIQGGLGTRGVVAPIDSRTGTQKIVGPAD